MQRARDTIWCHGLFILGHGLCILGYRMPRLGHRMSKLYNFDWATCLSIMLCTRFGQIAMLALEHRLHVRTKYSPYDETLYFGCKTPLRYYAPKVARFTTRTKCPVRGCQLNLIVQFITTSFGPKVSLR